MLRTGGNVIVGVDVEGIVINGGAIVCTSVLDEVSEATVIAG